MRIPVKVGTFMCFSKKTDKVFVSHAPAPREKQPRAMMNAKVGPIAGNRQYNRQYNRQFNRQYNTTILKLLVLTVY